MTEVGSISATVQVPGALVRKTQQEKPLGAVNNFPNKKV